MMPTQSTIPAHALESHHPPTRKTQVQRETLTRDSGEQHLQLFDASFGLCIG